jgi:superfamily II DNA or RNA helicase
MQPTYLSFDKGSIVVRSDVKVPYAVWDDRVRAFRVQALYYREIMDYLKRSDLSVIKDNVQDLPPCPNLICENIVLRGYQKRALEAWDKAGRRGVVVLPTGAGKTVVALKAIELVNQPTIVVVPTLDLMEQWKKRIEEDLKIEVGVYGGGDNILKAVTVSTYDSAYIRASEIGNKFSLIVLDEVHHLPSEGYRQIAEMFTAPYRMGLTATYEREDMLHSEIPRLIGGVVFRLKAEDLAGRYLSNYILQKIAVDLTEKEKIEYDKHYKVFTDYLSTNHIWLKGAVDFHRFIMRTAKDAEARQALLARNKAIDIAFNSEAKVKTLEEILSNSTPDDRILIFTQHNRLVYKISKRFLLPFITHTTDKQERQEVLSRFKEGRFRAIVTSKVLDEGIDVPEASVGVIVSGTGSSREFIQRLGRLLRKREGKEKQARLIELISKATSETRTSQRRRRSGSDGRKKKSQRAEEQEALEEEEEESDWDF